MSLWPFRRRASRKRPRSGTCSTTGSTHTDSESVAYDDGVSRSHRHGASDAPVMRRGNLKNRRTEPCSSSNTRSTTRKNSYSPGRRDSIHVDRRHRRDLATVGLDPWMRPNFNRSYERVGDETLWTGAPTLHGKGSFSRMSRRKSSKRRKTDRDREAEIKAMAVSAPTPSAIDTRHLSRMRTGSRRSKAAGPPLRRSLESPSSDVSLPMADSILSGMSSGSEHGAFHVTALSSLAPRPTLRYVVSPRWSSTDAQALARATSQKRRLSERRSISEDTLKAHKRIDDLANDLDASDIRELMERDKRRRERKKLSEYARAERRLARMADERKASQAKAAQTGSPCPPNLDRGVAGRELAGSGVDTTSAVLTSSEYRHATAAQPHLKALSGDASSPGAESQSQARAPPSEFHHTDNIPLGTIAQQNEPEAPAVEANGPQTSMNPILGKFTRANTSASKSSRWARQSRSTTSPPPGSIGEFGTSSRAEGRRKGRLSFSSLMRWGTRRNQRHSPGPSSFSNTSREEMQAAVEGQASAAKAPVQPPTVVASSGDDVVSMMKSSAGVPKRTRSRFREDLPELPLSPPDSRMASPEAHSIPEHPDMQQQMVRQGISRDPDSRISAPKGHPVDEMMRQTPVSLDDGSYEPSPEPHSISLASIDSEASWLSGRIGSKRSLGSRPTIRDGAMSRTASTNSIEDDHDITEDDYLARLTPGQLMHTMSSRRQRKSTGEALPSSEEDESMGEGEAKWGAVKARHRPAMVHGSFTPNRHSLTSDKVSIISSDEERGEREDWIEPETMSGIQRATSLNLGKSNAQRISAGSARLLEIAPSSADGKRRSTGAAHC